MHAANPAYGAIRPLFREVEERRLVTAANIEEDMGGGWLVAILHNPRQAHSEHFSIKVDSSPQLKANKREMIDTRRLHGLLRALTSRQVAFIQCFPSPL